MNQGSRAPGFDLPVAVGLLLACLRLRPDAGAIRQIQELSRVISDWPDFLSWVERHRVAPLVCRNLQRYGGGGVPATVMASLQYQVEVNASWSLVNATELVRLYKLFGDHGVDCLPLKGSVLALQVYGNLAHRYAGDIDLWVERARLELAEKLLKGSYYRIKPGFELTMAQRRRFIRLGHHSNFVHHQGLVSLELHWQLMSHHCLQGMDFTQLHRRATAVTLAGTSIPALSLTDTILYLCAHGSVHSWSRLFWLADLAEIVRSHPELDWRQVAALARETGLGRQVCLGLLLAQALLDVPLPAEIQAWAAGDPLLSRLLDLSVRMILTPDIQDPPLPLKIRLHTGKIRTAPSWSARLNLLHALLSAEDWQRQRFPDSLYLLYYLFRLPLWLHRRLRRASAAPKLKPGQPV